MELGHVNLSRQPRTSWLPTPSICPSCSPIHGRQSVEPETEIKTLIEDAALKAPFYSALERKSDEGGRRMSPDKREPC
jgi:hypothetical protein